MESHLGVLFQSEHFIKPSRAVKTRLLHLKEMIQQRECLGILVPHNVQDRYESGGALTYLMGKTAHTVARFRCHCSLVHFSCRDPVPSLEDASRAVLGSVFLLFPRAFQEASRSTIQNHGKEVGTGVRKV